MDFISWSEVAKLSVSAFMGTVCVILVITTWVDRK